MKWLMPELIIYKMRNTIIDIYTETQNENMYSKMIDWMYTANANEILNILEINRKFIAATLLTE